jgi:excisionase family DNA binding protein
MPDLTWLWADGTMSAVEDLLTAKQLQDLLKVDRITIYRMLSDGRLTGFKVGGQWRFSRRQIETWLQEQQTSPEVAEELPIDSQALPLHCIQAVQSIYAEALDVAAVTTNPDGTPLTYVNNSCAFCDLILATEEGRRRCAAAWSGPPEPGWRATTERPGQLRTCHAGLLCTGAPVHVGGQWVANFAACQFVAQPLKTDLSALAADLGLAESDLRAAVPSIRQVPEPTLARISGLVEQVAVTLGQIGQERLGLVSRLRRIAEITNL